MHADRTRPILLSCVLLLFAAGCQKEKQEEAWHVDQAQQRLDDQEPILSPQEREQDVARNPRIRWHYSAYETLDYVHLTVEEKDGGTLAVSISDPGGRLGLRGEFLLFSPPEGVTLEVKDASLDGQLKPGTWYVLSAASDGDRGTHLAKVAFKTVHK